MTRRPERGRSRTRRGDSRSWSPSPSRGYRGARYISKSSPRRSQGKGRDAPIRRKQVHRSPSPLTQASTFADDTVATTRNDSDDDEEKKKRRVRSKGDKGKKKSSKVESFAIGSAKDLNAIAKSLSLCALAISSDDDTDSDEEDDLSDDETKSRSVKKHRGPRKKERRGPSKRATMPNSRRVDTRDEDSFGTRMKSPHGGQRSGRHYRSREKPNEYTGRSYGYRDVERQDLTQARDPVDRYERRQGNYNPSGRAGNPLTSSSSRKAGANTRMAHGRSMMCLDDKTFQCATPVSYKEAFDAASANERSIFGRRLGRYGRSAEKHSRKFQKSRRTANIAIVRQLQLPPGPLGINVTSSLQGPTVASVSGHCPVRGLQGGDVLLELDGRAIDHLSAPEVISLFRSTRHMDRVITIRRLASPVM